MPVCPRVPGLTSALLITCRDRELANKKEGVGGRLEDRLIEEEDLRRPSGCKSRGRRAVIDSDEVSLRIMGT